MSVSGWSDLVVKCEGMFVLRKNWSQRKKKSWRWLYVKKWTYG